MKTNWFQCLPKSWQYVRLKSVVELKSIRESGSSLSEKYVGLENIEPWTGRLLDSSTNQVQSEQEESESKGMISHFSSGDALFGKLRPYLAKAHLAKEPGVCTTELLVMQPHKNVDGKFLLRVILTREFIETVNAETFGVKMPRADWNTVSNVVIPLPPLSQQRRISDYLDRTTQSIDSLIAAKKRLLELLAEKRRSIITQAVTHGLTADVTMKDSGVEWLGAVPKHWKVTQLRWFIKVLEQGWSPQADEKVPNEDEWGVLKLNAVKDGNFDTSKAKALPKDLEIPENLEIKIDDFLITRANTPELVGNVCYVKKTRDKLMLSDLIYRLRLREDQIDGNFLSYFLQSPVGRSQIEIDARGSSSSMVKISQGHILDWLILLPSIVEQREIVNYIDAKVSQIYQLQSVTKNAIALLQERRTSLISAAVTGQLQIPD
jgi:type I restriction enzyme, S subunit